MAVLGEIEHTTTYRYAKPVTFGTHRAMFMPRRGASARLQVFLPGAGWLDYDPTNQINCGFELIPVAVARHPGQAIPPEGAWFGDGKDYLGMSVSVAVRKFGDVYDPSAVQE
jgi:transglutaminase-like putative cysteine protease